MASAKSPSKAQRESLEAVDLLVEISNVLLSNLQVSAVLPKVVGEAKKLISADAYAVWMQDEGTKTWHIAASQGLSDGYRSQELNNSIGPMRKEPLVVPDVRKEPFLSNRRDAYEAEGIRGLLVVPITFRGSVRGTISFYYATARAISPRDIRYASAIANLAALAVTTAENSERQEREKRRSGFLAQAATLLASSLDYETTLKRVAELAVPDIADWCSVVTYENGKLQRVAVAHSDPKKLKFAEEFAKKFPEELREDRGVGRILKTGKSEIISRVSDEMLKQAARDEEHLSLIRKLGIISAIGVPLIARGRSLGVLRMISAESGRHFTQDDLDLAEDLASRAALAVDNARLHREVRDSENKLRLSEERLRLTQKTAQIASWEFNLELDEFVWSEQVYDLFQLPQSFQPTVQNFLSLLFVSTDREAVEKFLRQTSARKKEIQTRFRIRTPGGEVRWIEVRGRSFFNFGNNLMLGVFIGVTDVENRT